MNTEPKPTNPYEGMTLEELNDALAEFQEIQRELTFRVTQVMDAKHNLYLGGFYD